MFAYGDEAGGVTIFAGPLVNSYYSRAIDSFVRSMASFDKGMNNSAFTRDVGT